MKLARLALVSIDGNLGDLARLSFSTGPLEVWPLRPTSSVGTYLVIGTVDLSSPPAIGITSRLTVPEGPRIALEEAIEHHANILSIAAHSPRTISSPSPCVAFIAQNDLDRTILKESAGIEVSVGNRGIPSGDLLVAVDALDAILDRPDGVALLSEALSHQRASGRFREVIRLFERAFQLAGRKLIDPLSTFLEGGGLGYSSQEVASWITLRHGVSHADRKDRPLLDGDVAWRQGRTLQAGYDVLFNKARWQSADTCRRRIWRPSQGTSSEEADLFITAGVEARFSALIFDEFRRYPLHLKGILKDLPSGFWTGRR